MARVMTFSRFFPTYHPKAGKPTCFLEKLCKGFPDYTADDYVASKQYPHKGVFDLLPLEIESFADLTPKFHTIRAGKRWKVGDKFSPRVWSGKPYASKQITIAPDIEIKRVWDIEIFTNTNDVVNGIPTLLFRVTYEDGCMPITYRYGSNFSNELAKNDGLELTDMRDWFYPAAKKHFAGQIICWSDKIEY